MRIKIILLAILILAACAPQLLPTPDPAQIILPSPSPVEVFPTHPFSQGDVTHMPQNNPDPSPSLQNLIEQAKEDLAQRLSTSATEITVVDARDVVWSNSSLGCPQPGMLYAEVLTPGYLILLNANRQDYEYHAGKSSDAFYYERPDPPVEGMPDNT